MWWWWWWWRENIRNVEVVVEGKQQKCGGSGGGGKQEKCGDGGGKKKCGGGCIKFHYPRSSVERKLSLGSMLGRYEVDVFVDGKMYRINEEVEVEKKGNQD